MRPIVVTILSSAVAVGVACGLPTGACGCTPARTMAVVSGTLATAQGIPVPNTRIYFLAVPNGAPAEFLTLLGEDYGQTDSVGKFAVRVYSIGPGQLDLRATVIRTNPIDTVRITAGSALFRFDRADTVRVSLNIP